MYSRVISGVVRGVRSDLLSVETDMGQGLPSFTMVGALGTEVREAAERVRVALRHIGAKLPPSRITVNFSPADIPKKGTALDLPVAAGILICLGILGQEEADGVFMAGELGLNGQLLPVRGILPLIMCAREKGVRWCLLPKKNLAEAGMISGLRLIGADTLGEAVSYLKMPRAKRESAFPVSEADYGALLQSQEREVPDMAGVHGQQAAKRVLEIAAAGFHNALLIGPPGTGKSMLAGCLPGILPPLSVEEAMEVSSVYSVCGMLDASRPFIMTRPISRPHHTVTQAALLGGGNDPAPGMISFAHRGVLFMDEFPEFGARTLNLLRQPLEEHTIRIARKGRSIRYPARFQLIAAMNPCPCGYYPDRNRCQCTQTEIRRYRQHLPGPVLDRIDLCVEVKRVSFGNLTGPTTGESSAAVRKRVLAAVSRQRERFRGTGISFNAEMDSEAVGKYCVLRDEERRLMEEIYEKLSLSARSYHRLLKVARTIADLEGARDITCVHLAEAASYRIRMEEKEESYAE
ncbi:MAG: YifB family Mg chelatase-like AAA ATPase [Lachnospiraceae bacterium]|nr:YifB family Mg chelatase-like AAA ATPase [Lachnospiraceae bacterium]